jgi:hypothetical protein
MVRTSGCRGVEQNTKQHYAPVIAQEVENDTTESFAPLVPKGEQNTIQRYTLVVAEEVE